MKKETLYLRLRTKGAIIRTDTRDRWDRERKERLQSFVGNRIKPKKKKRKCKNARIRRRNRNRSQPGQEEE